MQATPHWTSPLQNNFVKVAWGLSQSSAALIWTSLLHAPNLSLSLLCFPISHFFSFWGVSSFLLLAAWWLSSLTASECTSQPGTQGRGKLPQHLHHSCSSWVFRESLLLRKCWGRAKCIERRGVRDGQQLKRLRVAGCFMLTNLEWQCSVLF